MDAVSSRRRWVGDDRNRSGHLHRSHAGSELPHGAALLGTVLLIAAGSGIPDRSGPGLVRLLGRQPLRWIGDVSYGFYLWHWPFLILVPEYVGHRLSVTENLALSGGALIMAWLSYRLIENPIRRAPTLSLRPKLALLL